MHSFSADSIDVKRQIALKGPIQKTSRGVKARPVPVDVVTVHGFEMVHVSTLNDWVYYFTVGKPASARPLSHVTVADALKKGMETGRVVYSHGMGENPVQEHDDLRLDVEPTRVKRARKEKDGWKGKGSSEHPVLNVTVPLHPGSADTTEVQIQNDGLRVLMEATPHAFAWLGAYVQAELAAPFGPKHAKSPFKSEVPHVFFSPAKSAWVVRRPGTVDVLLRVKRTGADGSPLSRGAYDAALVSAKGWAEALLRGGVAASSDGQLGEGVGSDFAQGEGVGSDFGQDDPIGEWGEGVGSDFGQVDPIDAL